MARYRKPSDEPADPLTGGDPVLPGDDHHLGTEVDTRAVGWLDGFLGLPWVPRVRSLDSKKIAAILLETNVVGLQRHLLTMTVQNQVGHMLGMFVGFWELLLCNSARNKGRQ